MNNENPSTGGRERATIRPAKNNRVRYATESGIAATLLWLAISSACDLRVREQLTNLPLAARIELSAQPQDGQVDLQWNVIEAPEDITSWEYQKRLAGESYGPWRSIKSDGTTGNYVAGDLTNGLIYAFRVKFTNENGDDVWSNEVIALPSAQEATEPDSSTEDATCASERLDVVAFVLGDHDIATDYMDNQASLERILDRLDDAIPAASYVLITGYASGTGKPSYNLDLSEKRGPFRCQVSAG